MEDSTDAGLLCPDDKLAAVINELQADDNAGLELIASLMQSYPLDPRLHFLSGSVLAGLQRYSEGRSAMARAVEISPEYNLARFQLGFLDLTSGNAVEAIGVWQPLFSLSDNEPLRVFAEGLTHLINDDFSEARRLLEKGMVMNRENPAINADMQLILDEIEGKGSDSRPTDSAVDSPVAPPSAAQMLLQQDAFKGNRNDTKH
jgi:tetratricopeptide (TPR) repeat protein